MADNNLSTGKSQLNSQLLAGAANLAGPALDIAQGATALQAASNALKGAFMDKLLGPTALLAGGLIGVFNTVRGIVRETQLLQKGLAGIASLQGIEGKFTVLLGSAVLAKKRIEELYEFAAKSSFDFKDVAEANRVLQSIAGSAMAGAKGMKIVGDMAAGTGTSMSDAAEKVAKLYSALESGRSMDKIIFQLQMSGVVTDKLASKLEGLEAAGAGFASKWAAVQDVLSQTNGSMAADAGNLDTLAARLKNMEGLMAKAFAEPYVDAQVKAMKSMIGATENFIPLVAQIGKDFSIFPSLLLDVKSGFIRILGASTGVVEGLTAIWNIGVTAFAALSAGTAAAIAANFWSMASAAKDTAASLADFYGKAMSAQQVISDLAAATGGMTEATEMMKRGEILAGAQLWISNALIHAKTRALFVHQGAADAATLSTGKFSLAQYIGTLASGAFGLALKAVGIAFRFVKAQAILTGAALRANPWFMVVAAVVAAAVALYKLIRAQSEAAAKQRELAAAIQETNDKLDAQGKAIKDLKSWDEAVTSLINRYGELATVIRDLEDAQDTRDLTKDEEGQLKAAEAEKAKVEERLAKESVRDTSKLKLGDEDDARIRESAAAARSASADTFGRDMDKATSPEERARLRQQRMLELSGRIAEGKGALDRASEGADADRQSDYAFERRRMHVRAARGDDASDAKKLDGSFEGRFSKRWSEEGRGAAAWAKPAEAGSLRDKMKAEDAAFVAAAKARRDASDEKINREQAARRMKSTNIVTAAQANYGQVSANPNASQADRESALRVLDDAQATLKEVANEEKALADLKAQAQAEEKARLREIRSMNIDAAYDAQALAAIQAGAGTDQIEAQRAAAHAAEKSRNAFEDAGKNKNAPEVVAARNEEKRLKAEAKAKEVDFAHKAWSERRANESTIKGDKKGAQPYRDAEALIEMQNDYKKNNMTAEQATSDFTKSLLADAAGRSPSVVATSLQSIGGGGGFSAGGDPVRAAQERSLKAQEKTAELNALILKALQGTPQ